jgi:23S rRNA (cytosine1962-C5)-methyltransferase
LTVGPFRPWLEERILRDDGELLIVDKPSGVPVHGGDERLPGDVVTRLGAWLRATGSSEYLGVHQRLDVGTSGVLAFVRNPELNARLARDFEAGAVEKEYVAAVRIAASSPFARADSLTLEHRLAPGPDRRMRAVQRGGKPCRTRCRVLERRGDRALVALRPETGRTHQLRVQLAESFAPIAGDREYGGARAPRLLLHARSLALPGLGVSVASAEPEAFAHWLNDAEDALGTPAELARRLADAAVLRYPLLERTDTLRWVNGWGDALSGVVVDWYRGHTTLSLTSEAALAREAELAAALVELGAESVYAKRRPKADLRRVDAAELAPPDPVAGAAAAEPLVVNEDGTRVEVALGEGFSTGLFVDQRDNRRRVRETCAGAAVLNLFCYTGAFSVAAALGGAARVTSVDVSRRALERAQHNFALNGLDPSLHTFARVDVTRFLTRAAARGERFDWVVLDPPSFSSTGPSGVLRLDRDYAHLLDLSLVVLGRRGRLLAVTNHRGTSRSALRKLVLQAAERAGRAVVQAKELGNGLDCPDGRDGPEPSRAVLLTVA